MKSSNDNEHQETEKVSFTSAFKKDVILPQSNAASVLDKISDYFKSILHQGEQPPANVPGQANETPIAAEQNGQPQNNLQSCESEKPNPTDHNDHNKSASSGCGIGCDSCGWNTLPGPGEVESEKKNLTLEDIEKMEKATAGNVIGSALDPGFVVTFGNAGIVESVPRDLGIHHEFIGVLYEVLPFFPLGVLSPTVLPPPPIANNGCPVVVCEPFVCGCGCENSCDCGASHSIGYGNLLTNDIPGPGGPISVYSFTYNGTNGSGQLTQITDVIGPSGSATVTTYYGGTLTVNADGLWTYVAPVIYGEGPQPPQGDGSFNDNFGFTITNSYGEMASASQLVFVNGPSQIDVLLCDMNELPGLITDVSNGCITTCELNQLIKILGDLENILQDNFKLGDPGYNFSLLGLPMNPTNPNINLNVTQELANLTNLESLLSSNSNSSGGAAGLITALSNGLSLGMCGCCDQPPIAINDCVNVKVHEYCCNGQMFETICPTPITGNVLINDQNLCCDVIVLEVSSGKNTVEITNYSPVTIAGEYGDLTISANGNFTYTLDPGVTLKCGESDVFDYTIMEGSCVYFATADIDINFNVISCHCIKAVDDCITANVLEDYCTQCHVTTTTCPEPITGNALSNVCNPCNDVLSITKVCFDGNSVCVPSTGVACIAGTYGVLTISANGNFCYTINPHATPTSCESDSFQYTVVDSNGNCCSTSCANINIDFCVTTHTEAQAQNDCITAHVLEDYCTACHVTTTTCPEPITGNALVNICNPDNDCVSITKISFDGTTVCVPTTGNVCIQGTYGTLSIDANGDYCYTIDRHATPTNCDTDSFQYTLVDSFGNCTTCADLNIGFCVTTHTEAQAQNDCITAHVLEDYCTACHVTTTTCPEPITGNALANICNPDNDCVSITKISFDGNTVCVPTCGSVCIQGTYGTLSIDANGDFTYTIDKHATPTDCDSDTFQYTMVDSFGNCTTCADLNIGFCVTTHTEAQAVNDCVTANVVETISCHHTTSITCPSPITGNALTNDCNPCNDPIIISSISFDGTSICVPSTGDVCIKGDYGTLTIDANGDYSYVLNKNSAPSNCDSDTFTYTLLDEFGHCVTTANININFDVTVKQVNDQNCHKDNHCDDKPLCDQHQGSASCDKGNHQHDHGSFLCKNSDGPKFDNVGDHHQDGNPQLNISGCDSGHKLKYSEIVHKCSDVDKHLDKHFGNQGDHKADHGCKPQSGSCGDNKHHGDSSQQGRGHHEICPPDHHITDHLHCPEAQHHVVHH